jgi:transposase-like protein
MDAEGGGLGMIIDDYPELLESVTVFESTGTYDENGKPSTTKKSLQGIWKDSIKVIQIGLGTTLQSKARLILKEDVKSDSRVFRGSKNTLDNECNTIIWKRVLRDLDGRFEGIEVFL